MTELDAVGTPELREVLAFVRGRQQPPTAEEAAEALGLSRSVARWRLERLAETGALEPRFGRRSGGPGAGRPAKRYAVPPETAALEFPVRRYEKLLRALIDALPRRDRRERLAAVGGAFGRELAQAARLRPASRADTAFARLCEGLGRLGFQASVESVGTDGAVIVTPTCPLRPLVVEDDEARAIDEGMWAALVTEALREPRYVRCETEGCRTHDRPCRVRVQL